MDRPPPFLALAAAAALAACGPKDPGAPPGAAGAGRAYRVAVETVRPRPLEYSLEAVGSLEAYDVVTLPARVPGVLESLTFDEGDTVAAGQVLAVVDGRRYALDLDQAKAALGRAAAGVDSAAARTRQADAALKEAASGLARRRGLREKNPGWVTEDELTTLETAVERAKASLEEARAGEKFAQAQVEEARSALALAEKHEADASVRSPMAGAIERRHVSPGQYLKEGEPVATLVDATRVRVRFRVSESESVKLLVGQAVEVRVAAFPSRAFRGEVFHVNATADPATRMVECLAAVKDPEPGLRPGFFAAVGATIARREDAVVIPEASVLPTEAGFTAFVVEDGRARARSLRLGLHTRGEGVEVISGLSPGEVLVVGGAGALEDGVAVQVVAPAGEGPAGGPAGSPREGKE